MLVKDKKTTSAGKDKVIEIYRRRAQNYDFTAKLYCLVGIDIKKYRKMAIDALELKEGDTVVDLGCGTGLNFELIENVIGSSGKIIGVDVTDRMLAQAKMRIQLNSWNNVELIHSDVVQYQFPPNVDAVISTGVFGYILKYDEVIKKVALALNPLKRFVIIDCKEPSNLFSFFTPLFLSITRTFGVDKEYLSHRTQHSFKKCFNKVSMTEFHGGFIYILVGENS